MHIGFIGLGSVVETAYLPALGRLALPDTQVHGFDVDPARAPEGVALYPDVDALLAQPLDIVFVTTSSVQHLAMLERALASPVARIVVEKPVCADLDQLERLRRVLEHPEHRARVLALDHWTVRSAALGRGCVDPAWLPRPGQTAALSFELGDVLRLEGRLLEVSGFNAQGEPIALNFATGLPDRRQLRHPDGVIVDIGTHVLAMLREVVHQLGGDDTMTLQRLDARDRLGRPIARGDWQTAEGSAHLRGTLGSIPVDIRLDKYAGPNGGQKGIRIVLRDGRVISQDRRDGQDIVELEQAGEVYRWSLDGPLYDHCIERVLSSPAPEAVTGATARRMAEVEVLLRLHEELRGPVGAEATRAAG